MIARIWHGATLNEKAKSYLDVLRRTGVSEYTATSGNLGVLVLSKGGDKQTDFEIISFWDSMEAVSRFAGPDPQKAVYYPEDKDYLLEFEPGVRHYEVEISTFKERRGLASK